MAPRRFKKSEELTPAEWLAHRRDPDYRVETVEYVRARSDAMIAAGLDDETVDSPEDPRAMSTDQLVGYFRKRRTS